MNTKHHDRGDSGLGGPLIWTITTLLALTAIALIISILPERIHEPSGLSERRINEPPTTLPRQRIHEPPTALQPKPR
jgi:hypothetical protein